jgi:hypothetical protein
MKPREEEDACIRIGERHQASIPLLIPSFNQTDDSMLENTVSSNDGATMTRQDV